MWNDSISTLKIFIDIPVVDLPIKKSPVQTSLLSNKQATLGIWPFQELLREVGLSMTQRVRVVKPPSSRTYLGALLMSKSALLKKKRNETRP